MTQSNSIDYNDTISGTQLSNFLNDDYEALLTNHKGPSRPSYIQTGQFWIDDSSTPWAFNIYDGTNDITLFSIDPTGDSYTLTDFDFSSLAGDGLKEGTNNLDIEPADFAGSGLIDDGNDNLGFAGKAYLQHDGLTIANNSTDSDHDIDVSGGQVGVHDFSGNWQVIELNDESPAFQIDTTGDNGLINGSTLTADTWYELAVIADSTKSNGPSVVGYTDANRPVTSSDLPTGYDLFRGMGTPGKTWWVKTDGSSNIFGFDHSSDGWMIWTPTSLSTFSDIINSSTPNGSDSLTISEQVPPTQAHITLNSVFINANTNGGWGIGFHNKSLSSNTNRSQEAMFINTGNSVTSPIQLNNVTNQNFNYFLTSTSNLEKLIISRVSTFKAVE